MVTARQHSLTGEKGLPRLTCRVTHRKFWHSPCLNPFAKLVLGVPIGAPSTSLALRSTVLCQNLWYRTILAKVLLAVNFCLK